MNNEVVKATEVLQQGGTIAYPTDTVWGLGCDATNEEAVKKIYKIKDRDDSKALIILINEIWQLNKYIDNVPDVALDIMEFEERPLTVILSGAKNLAPNVMAADGTIAVRLVKDDFCGKIIERLKRPIVSTSCNMSGKTTPQLFSEIDSAVLNQVDYVVNWRQEDKNRVNPSKIIKLGPNGEFELIRN